MRQVSHVDVRQYNWKVMELGPDVVLNLAIATAARPRGTVAAA
jgi:hypothetical protein